MNHQIIFDGNNAAHKGDCLADARLWDQYKGKAKRGAHERYIYERMYGVAIGLVQNASNSPKVILCINWRGTIAADKYLSEEDKKKLFGMVHTLVFSYLAYGMQARSAVFDDGGALKKQFEDANTEYKRLSKISKRNSTSSNASAQS